MRLFVTALALALSACSPREPGFAWDVRVQTARNGDTCHDPAVLYDEAMTFVLRFDGADTRIALGEDDFATGRIAGCNVNYRSVIWSERRDDYTLRWQMTGEAEFRYGASTCDIDGGHDWLGTETFEILSSDHPEVEAGCAYTVDVTGTYAGAWP